MTRSTLECLNEEQLSFYEENGYLVLEDRIPMDIIEAIREEIDRFAIEAATLDASNDRIDLEDTHTRDNPRMRRIKLPHTTSDIVADLMRSDHVLAPARDLIGPNLRLHTSKLNMKSANYGAAIEWHQDMAFYPHTNDDVLAIAVIIDDMRDENGPLMVFPGSHRGPTHDHHSNGVFAGGINMETSGLDTKNAVALTGPAGSISIHHGRIVHGSALNTSNRDRRLLFYEMMAADSFPIMGSMTRFDDIAEYDQRMLCGASTLDPRLSDWPVRIPQPQPDAAWSIYEIQKNLKTPAFKKHEQD